MVLIEVRPFNIELGSGDSLLEAQRDPEDAAGFRSIPFETIRFKPTPSAPAPTYQPSHLRTALRPLLALSRLLGTAPFVLRNADTLRLRRSLPATAYSTLLLAAFSTLAYFYVTSSWRVRFESYKLILSMAFVMRLFCEVGVAILALGGALAPSRHAAIEALLLRADEAATLLNYRPLRTRRLLTAQVCAVAALLPPHLYFAEEEYFSKFVPFEYAEYTFPPLELAVAQVARACAFVVNAAVTVQFCACALLAAQLWQRFGGELEQLVAARGPVAPRDGRLLRRKHLALTDLVDQISSVFGRQTALQMAYVLSVVVTTCFYIAYNLLITNIESKLIVSEKRTNQFWMNVPYLFACALCIAQLAAMSGPCAAVEAAAAQCDESLGRLASAQPLRPAARDLTWLAAQRSVQELRMETAAGTPLGTHIWIHFSASALIYFLVLVQFTSSFTFCMPYKPVA